jgi:hypothetical protein
MHGDGACVCVHAFAQELTVELPRFLMLGCIGGEEVALLELVLVEAVVAVVLVVEK